MLTIIIVHKRVVNIDLIDLYILYKLHRLMLLHLFLVNDDTTMYKKTCQTTEYVFIFTI